MNSDTFPKSQTLSQFIEDRNNELVALNTQCSAFDYNEFRSSQFNQGDKVSK